MAKTIGRYEIREELGRGGMSAVYRAFDSRLDREVALKLLDQQLSSDPAFTVRFEREAKTVASLEHSTIVPLYDFGEAGGWLYLVMRYLKGGTLKQLIAKGALEPQQANYVVRRIGAALDKAHGQGIIHRDLKPANILLDEDQKPYLSDFGIVKVAQGDTEYLTETGQTLGTYAYMSPEQLLGKEVSGRSDIYALGIVLFEMLTGAHPFAKEATTTAAMAIAHAQSPVPKASEANATLPPAVDEVIQKAMAKDPNDRYASGSEMAQAVQAVLSVPPPAATAGVAAAAAATAVKSPPVQQPAPAPKTTPPPQAQQPVSRPPAQEVTGQPAASLPAGKKKRKIPIWLIAVVGVAILSCICLVIVGSSVLGDIFGSSSSPRILEEAIEEPAEEPTEAPVEEPMPDLSGETVTIFTVAGDEQVALLEDSLRLIEEQTGVDVIVENSPEFETEAVVRAEAGDPPDIYAFPQPGLMADFARRGFLVDLSQFLEDDYLRQQYKQSWLDTGTVDGALVGIWHETNIKSLVWYAKKTFDERGYDIPQTWDEMLALTEQIASDGLTPWCIGIESGAATGWVGTDWIEDILLRTAGPDKYDQWLNGQLPFDSPEVRQAFQVMGEIWLEPAFVLGGVEGIVSTNFFDAVGPIFDDPPGCLMHRQAGFITLAFPEDAEFGVDVDYFYLPPIDQANQGKPVLIAGSVFSLARDTLAGRTVMEYLTTGDSVRAEVEAGSVLAPHNDVPLEWYPDELHRGYARILADADTVRFDAADLMPSEVGTGSFWSGIVDYVNGADLDTVLRTIDASWP